MTKIVHKSEFVLMRNIMENMLETHGYETINVETDEEMLETLEKERIDFVIYDLGKSYAPSIFDKIKKVSPHTKTTISTSMEHPRIYAEFHKRGMYPFLKKPINGWQLVEILDHYIPGTRKEIPFVVQKERFGKVEYRGRSKNHEELFFKYNGSNFFVHITWHEHEIQSVMINHNTGFLFRCEACGAKEDNYDECPSFINKHEELFAIILADPKVREEATELVSKWDSYLQKK